MRYCMGDFGEKGADSVEESSVEINDIIGNVKQDEVNPDERIYMRAPGMVTFSYDNKDEIENVDFYAPEPEKAPETPADPNAAMVSSPATIIAPATAATPAPKSNRGAVVAGAAAIAALFALNRG